MITTNFEIFNPSQYPFYHSLLRSCTQQTEDCLKKISYDSKKKINTLKIFSYFFITVCQDPAPNWRNIQPPSGPLAAQGRSGSSVTSGDLNLFCKFLKGDIQEKHCSNVRWGLAIVIIFSVCNTSFEPRLTGLKLPPCHPCLCQHLPHPILPLEVIASNWYYFDILLPLS